MTTIASPSVCSRVADLAATRIALWQEGYLTGDSAAVADLARLRRGAGSHAAETPDLRSLVDTGPREPSARRRTSDRIRDEFGPGVIRPTTLLRVGGPVQPPPTVRAARIHAPDDHDEGDLAVSGPERLGSHHRRGPARCLTPAGAAAVGLGHPGRRRAVR
jgi:hypothetical protein